jgi:hypothetical protein
LLDRCPSCLKLLGWTKLPNVWSCATCKFDLRTAAPKWCPPETVAAAKALIEHIVNQEIAMPAPLGELPFLDILKTAGWLAYFRALPNDLNLAVSAKNAALGFSQLRRWPDSFDEVVLNLLGANMATNDTIMRHSAAARITTAIDRLSSGQARDLIKARLMHVLRVDPEFTAAFHAVTEPVLHLGVTVSQLPHRR